MTKKENQNSPNVNEISEKLFKSGDTLGNSKEKEAKIVDEIFDHLIGSESEEPDDEPEKPLFPKSDTAPKKRFKTPHIIMLVFVALIAVALTVTYMVRGGFYSETKAEKPALTAEQVEDVISKIDYKGKPYDSLKEELTEENLPHKFSFTDENKDNKYKPGEVIEVKRGNSKGGAEFIEVIVFSPVIEVPDWVGKTKEEVEKDSKEKGFRVKFAEVESTKTPNTVAEMSSNPGDKINLVETEITVGIAIPKEIVEISVPDVSGKGEKEAITSLAEKGFTELRFVKVKVSDSKMSGKVIETSPKAGEKAKNGEALVVIVGE